MAYSYCINFSVSPPKINDMMPESPYISDVSTCRMLLFYFHFLPIDTYAEWICFVLDV